MDAPSGAGGMTHDAPALPHPARHAGTGRRRWLPLAFVALLVAFRLPTLLCAAPTMHGADDSETMIADPSVAALEAEGSFGRRIRAFFSELEVVLESRPHLVGANVVNTILFLPFALLLGPTYFAIKIFALLLSCLTLLLWMRWLLRTFPPAVAITFGFLFVFSTTLFVKWTLMSWSGFVESMLPIVLVLSASERAFASRESFVERAGWIGFGASFAFSYSLVCAPLMVVVVAGAVLERRNTTPEGWRRLWAGLLVGLFWAVTLQTEFVRSDRQFTIDKTSIFALASPDGFIDNLVGSDGFLTFASIDGVRTLQATMVEPDDFLVRHWPSPGRIAQGGVLAMLVLAVVLRRRGDAARARTLALILLFLAGYILMVTVSHRYRLMNSGRYLVPVLPLWFACIAVPLGLVFASRRAVPSLVAAGLLVVFIAPGVNDTLALATKHRRVVLHDWDAVRYVRHGIWNVATEHAKAVSAFLARESRHGAVFAGFRTGFSGRPEADWWPFPHDAVLGIDLDRMRQNVLTAAPRLDDVDQLADFLRGVAHALHIHVGGDIEHAVAFAGGLPEAWRGLLLAAFRDLAADTAH